MPDPTTLGMVLSLLPRGTAWSRDPSSWTYKLCYAISEELDRVDTQIGDFLSELDPRNANALLAEWETMLGIPGDCTNWPTSTSDRAKCVHAKLVFRGGNEAAAGMGYASPMPLWRRIASILGYGSLTITEYPISDGIGLRAGAPLDLPLVGDAADAANTIHVSVGSVSASMDAAFECLLRWNLHEHVVLNTEFT